MDTLQAAILIEKLTIFPEELELRQRVVNRYEEAIDSDEENYFGVTAPLVNPDCTSVWAQYTVSCKRRDELQAKLRQDGIPTMVYYQKPMHFFDALRYLGYQEGDFPVAENACHTVLSLPFHPYLKTNDQLRIIMGICES
jgi:UDP-2-acetamido-2-deoxy-ribo-hexuluronate aminotransferase